MDHDLDKLPQCLRQVITSSPEFLKKSSTYNNLVAMAATVVCNYNQTHMGSHSVVKVHNPFSWTVLSIIIGELHQVSCKTGLSLIWYLMIQHHLQALRIHKTLILWYCQIFCKDLRNENPYCVNLRFLGVEARQCAEGINVVPRMVHQGQHFDVALL